MTPTYAAETFRVPLFLGGRSCPSKASRFTEVRNPATQELLGLTPVATSEEINEAVETAQEAFFSWREVPVPERARCFFRLQELLKRHQKDLAQLICKEQGKTLQDAEGDVFRGLEVVEHACHIASLMMGETVPNVARGVDTYSICQPLGVCVGITPFNFPVMVPLWMFPLAIAAGNTFVLKPSERVPFSAMRLAELAAEAGLPEGVLNVVHGGQEVVEQLVEHPLVKAISFVGSTPVGQVIYRKGCAAGKRVQCLVGAKNHAVVLADADRETALNGLVGAAFGASGQRCMAISVAVLVGGARQWLPKLVDKARALTVGVGTSPGVDMGPLVSREAKARVERLIQSGVDQGATLELDGRGISVSGFGEGNFVGPTILSRVLPYMEVYRQEVFGPVLLVVEASTLEEAVDLVNDNPCGNGAACFTSSGASARYFQQRVQAGMVGINLPIPVPLPFFSFTGWKGSIFGDLHAYGKEAVRFYTQTKTITARWPAQSEPGRVNTTIHLQHS